MSRRRYGLCKLTGREGPLAKAHIIPDAFMRRASAAPFMERDGVSRSIKRFTGWYDRDILGGEGEALIAAFDDAAAKCFIDRGFTYRSRRHPGDLNVLRGGFLPNSVHEVTGVETRALRLFGLSLLWRAAVSTLPAMDLVTMRSERLHDIGERLLAGDPGPHLEFPVYFGVFCDAQELTKVAPYQPDKHPFYRFFLDGIVAYVSPRRTLLAAKRYGRLIVGGESDRFPVYCFSSLNSNHADYVDRTGDRIRANEGDIFAGFRDL